MESATHFSAKPHSSHPSHIHPRLARPFTILLAIISLLIFPLLIHHRPHLPTLLSHSTQNIPSHRPLIVYPKPRKTGSTFISSMLGTAVLRSGGRIAPCHVASLMHSRAHFYGLVRGYDLLGCHTAFASISVPALTRIPREVVFVTSIREPTSWFASAAVWVKEKKLGVVVDSQKLFREAIDDALAREESFVAFRKLFFANYGATENSTIEEIQAATNVYSYVFDHATAEMDVNDALEELGYESSIPSSRREGVYDPKWFDGYRTAEVQNATKLERLLYVQLKKVRDARKAEHVPWAKLGRRETKVVYSALAKQGLERQEAMRNTAGKTRDVAQG